MANVIACPQASADVRVGGTTTLTELLVLPSEIDATREVIAVWLAQSATDPEFASLYKTWLDTGGELEAVEASIRSWLREHAARPDAALVYEAWLEAGGDLDAIRPDRALA
jgi:hypothetical protein